MPIFAHGFAGIGLGGVTAGWVRSTRLRPAWVGCCFFLAYWPDVTEWTLRTLGFRMTQSAFTSIPVVLASSLIWALLVRWMYRERSGLAWWGLLLAIGSHLLLDTFDGGIPLWWPFSSRMYGPDLFGLHSLGPVNRLARELVLFGWMAVVGAIALAMRSIRPGRATEGSLLHRILPSAVWVAPIFALSLVHGYIDWQIHRGDSLWASGNYQEALPYYLRANQFQTVDGYSAGAIFKAGYCYEMTGHERLAGETYERGVREFPNYTPLLFGLADYYLKATDPAMRRPAEVPALAERIRHNARKAYEFRDADRLLARARQMMGGSATSTASSL